LRFGYRSNDITKSVNCGEGKKLISVDGLRVLAELAGRRAG